MRAFLVPAALLAAFSLASPAAAAERHNVCLDTMHIQNTTEPDDHTILFHMDDGAVWANHLRNACPGLRFNGFSYEATPPHQICGGLQSIRVLRAGTVCMLGEFERVHGKGDRQ